MKLHLAKRNDYDNCHRCNEVMSLVELLEFSEQKFYSVLAAIFNLKSILFEKIVPLFVKYAGKLLNFASYVRHES